MCQGAQYQQSWVQEWRGMQGGGEEGEGGEEGQEGEEGADALQ